MSKKYKKAKEAIPHQPETTIVLPKRSNEDIIGYIILVVIVMFFFFIRQNFASIPFERDEGSYSYYGKLLIEGKIPYKDFYEQKFPGIFFFYAFFVWIFGYSVENLHLGFNILNIASLILIYLSARRLFSVNAGILSAIAFGFLSLNPHLSGFTIQSEHGVSFFACLSLYIYTLIIDDRKIWKYALIGISTGLAFMTKTSGIFFPLAFGLTMLIQEINDKNKWSRAISRITIYIIGFILTCSIFFFVIYLQGSFQDMIFYAIEIPKKYLSKISAEYGMQLFNLSLDNITRNHNIFFISILLSLPCFAIKNISLERKILIAAFSIFSFFTIVPGFYFYGHYWIQLVPGVAILTGFCYESLTSFISQYFNFKTILVKTIYMVIAFFAIVLHIATMDNYYFSPDYTEILRNVYGNNPFPETYEIGNYLNGKMSKDDQVTVIGSEPELYIYTNKKPVSKHIFFSAMMENADFSKQWQREFVSDIEKNKPKFIVYYRVPISLLVQPNSDRYIFNWIDPFFNKFYKLTGLVTWENGIAKYNWNYNNTPIPEGDAIFIFERK